MKKLSKLFLLISIMVCCGHSMAQTRASMLLGGSYPLKEFALYDGLEHCALFKEGAVQGAAGIGFNAGLRWYFNVGVKGLGIMLSVDGFYNGPTEALKNAYRNKEHCFDSQYIGNSFVYNSTSGYINVPAMLGLNYVYYIDPKFGVFLEAGVGGNARFITSRESVGEIFLQDETSLTEHNIRAKERIIQYYDHMFSLAYQAGIGFEVSKKFVISCSFYDLGSAVAKGKRVVNTTNLETNYTESESDYPSFGTTHPVMVVGRIGFMF